MTSRFAIPAKFRRRETTAVVLVAVCALLPARAVAQSSEPLQLEWDAPPGCPTEQQVRDRMRQLAGSAKSSGARLRAEATVTRGDDGKLRLKLTVHAGNLKGERHIEGKSCDDLAGATAVALALLLQSEAPLSERDLVGRENADAESSPSEPSRGETATQDGQTASPQPGSAEEAPKPAAQSPKPPATTTEPERSQAPTSNVEARPVRRWRALIQAPSVAFGLGPLPGPSYGLALAFGVSLYRWRFSVAGSGWLRQALTANDQPGVAANVDRLTARIRGCRAIVVAPLEAGPCLTFAVEHISARGLGAHVAPRTANATWVAAGLGVQARLHVTSSVGLAGGIDVEIEASRPKISIDGVGSVGQLEPGAVTMTLGPEWIL